MTNRIILILWAFAQSVAFSLVSRSRNRDSIRYHAIASVLSNAVWFLTFRQLVTQNMSFELFIPYTIGTASGSIYGVKVSMAIEKWLNARSDSHLAGNK
jgi:hypothetical protein